jgi:adenylate cyclase
VITAILFTDLVGPTSPPRGAGRERAQEASRAHRRLLSDAAWANGGRELQWLGAGLMVAFPSVSDALQAAVAVQQAARWPVDGMRLAVRVGVDVGETLRDNRDHFGTTVVVARRLCDQAESGQILCSALVAELLGGGRTFRFQSCGQLSIDGIAAPVDACEVLYEDRRAHGASRRQDGAASAGPREADETSGPLHEPTAHLRAGTPRGGRARGLIAKFFACLRWIKS